jgi:CRP-like cAMP-binding protein
MCRSGSNAENPLNPERNHLLATLSADETSRLKPHLVQRVLTPGQYLYTPGQAISHAIFPIDGFVALLHSLRDGTSTELALVGREGLVGMPLILGGRSTPVAALVVNAGLGWSLPAAVVQLEFARRGPFARKVLRYAQALMTEMGQTAVCSRHHTIVQQLSRWLLQSLDRLGGSTLTMTQELIANMLGVRRAGVTEAAMSLQRAKVIRYSRGHIEVLNRVELEHGCCECYFALRGEFHRLLNEEPRNADAELT